MLLNLPCNFSIKLKEKSLQEYRKVVKNSKKYLENKTAHILCPNVENCAALFKEHTPVEKF